LVFGLWLMDLADGANAAAWIFLNSTWLK
jgi:hypothetical protein